MKNTYYFPHDYHARHDPKVDKLFMTLGYEGIGIYWCLIEMLYEQGGYLQFKDLILYARQDKSLCERITMVVRDFGLFKEKGDRFWSDSCIKRLAYITEKSSKAAQSAHIRWDANAMPTHSDGNAIKEKKGKESKEIPPTADFLSSLKTNPAYKHINIDNELLKMDTWLAQHPGRKRDPSFVLRWLNKIEAPIGTLARRITA